MVKCLICGKEFENGFGPEICPECLGDVQPASSQQDIPEEYKAHYSGIFGECDYDTRMFRVVKGFSTRQDMTYLCYNHNCGLQPYVPKGYTSCYEMFRGSRLSEGFSLDDNFDTSHVTNMNGMFMMCILPKGFSLGKKFDTSHVTDMCNMFSRCVLPEGFSLGEKFHVSANAYCWDMFDKCKLPRGIDNLESVDTIIRKLKYK